MFLCFPVTCNPSSAVTLLNLGVFHYIRFPHRAACPYAMDVEEEAEVGPIVTCQFVRNLCSAGKET